MMYREVMLFGITVACATWCHRAFQCVIHHFIVTHVNAVDNGCHSVVQAFIWCLNATVYKCPLIFLSPLWQMLLWHQVAHTTAVLSGIISLCSQVMLILIFTLVRPNWKKQDCFHKQVWKLQCAMHFCTFQNNKNSNAQCFIYLFVNNTRQDLERHEAEMLF